jgi:hypothetical protein
VFLRVEGLPDTGTAAKSISDRIKSVQLERLRDLVCAFAICPRTTTRKYRNFPSTVTNIVKPLQPMSDAACPSDTYVESRPKLSY